MAYRTWAEISLKNAENNFRIIKNHLDGKIKMCCVIKADAYGHGAAEISKLYEKLGADYFAVATFDEACELRMIGIKTPILIFGITLPECAQELSELDISQCVYSSEYASLLAENLAKSGKKIKIHIKIDTGMNRLGFVFGTGNDGKSVSEIVSVCNNPSFEPEGIFTHFCVADDLKSGKAFTYRQFDIFMNAISLLEEKGISFKIRHCSNSAATALFPEMQLDMVRAGLSLYGFGAESGLVPVMELKTVISHIKEIKQGETVGYGRNFTAKTDMKVATLPIGYADGFLRANSANGTSVFVNGKKCRILGNICMDQMMIDVTGLDVKLLEEVTVFGKDYNTAEDIAENNKTIVYEILCLIGKRVPRIYK